MVDITFLEIHVEDPSASASLLGDGRDADDDVSFEAADEARPPERGGSSKGAVLAAIVGLVFLVVVAYLVKTRFLSDEEDGGVGGIRDGDRDGGGGEFEFDSDD
ncbi:MAG: hypothetical protein ABEJ05_06970 [Haloglomus sp.]